MIDNPSPTTELLFKCYKNKLNYSLGIAKCLYYGNKIEETKSNIKSAWRVFNEILSKKRTQQNLTTSFYKFEKEELFDPLKIAEKFCKYFTSSGPNLAKTISAPERSYRSFCTEIFVNSLVLRKSLNKK